MGGSGMVTGSPGQPGLEWGDLGPCNGEDGAAVHTKGKQSGDGTPGLTAFEKINRNWILPRVKTNLQACSPPTSGSRVGLGKT